MKLSRALGLAVVPLALLAAYPASASTPKPVLVGRAVLPVETYAPGPPSGAFMAGQTVNGISFPTPSQPVEGFSSMINGRAPGEYLAMPDNGFGGKATSGDFLIRAYYIEPDFKTANGGTGAVTVKDFIEFRDPNGVIGFDIVNKATTARLLTGKDIDPESLQRAKNGDLWVGDEFGPWVLHFDATGVLLEPPLPVPGNLVQPAVPGTLMSPNNPFLSGSATQPNSRGFEAMSSTPDGKYLYPILEGATVVDTDQSRRFLFEFSVGDAGFTGRVWQYHTEQPAYMVADMQALDENRMVVIERDAGRGVNAVFRNVYVVDLRDVGPDGFLVKHKAVDLAAIPDPDLISLPEIHTGDVRLGDPFGVACESIEAIHVIDGQRLLLGCDNNFPNTGRNPNLADDNEFIVVKVPGLKSLN
ncbi:esterase-like activity of phytase family protein [Kribbella sp. NPDC026596]|uniref:esterase-like activity of phytase family protein n=1 Tax=Kribbella sp. NPDC026596 TaxID=3155122 RepID=UPI0033E34AB6